MLLPEEIEGLLYTLQLQDSVPNSAIKHIKTAPSPTSLLILSQAREPFRPHLQRTSRLLEVRPQVRGHEYKPVRSRRPATSC